ncbi:hypothetical protein Golomagni_01304 [Golovinomyces magnicellulatus]|nr:hypothetical protein Golomagni_01304 [Golovinomyces magnicellulatus]
MNLSNLVHPGRSQAEQTYHQNDSQIRCTILPSPTLSPYMLQGGSQKQKFSGVSAPKPPPSPPADKNLKCSLPSISSLLGLVDNSRYHELNQTTQQSSYNGEIFDSKATLSEASKKSYFDSGYQLYGPSLSISSRGAFPLTPPLHSDSTFEVRQSSPSVISSSGNSITLSYSHELGLSLPNEATSADHKKLQNQFQNVQPDENTVSFSTQGRNYSQCTAEINDGQFQISPHQRFNSLNSDPIEIFQPPQPQVSGLYYQRPLPQQFSPSSMQIPTSNSHLKSENRWQHHHYISPSSAASFPQSQDRYVCQTCNKAFSRPSSLLIHSHSHTGAKPFKCTHRGCGKAFSVRSNMKRHERGCHSSEGSSEA